MSSRSTWLVCIFVACGGGGDTQQVVPDAADHDAAPTLTCGAGTHDDNGTCVLDDRFDIRTVTSIRADGHSVVEVRVVGIDAGGAAVKDNVIVTVDRASAGTVVSPLFRLGDRGGATSFLPCNSTTAGCTGAARLSIARASAPTVSLAHVDVMLVAPAPVGSITPCMTGGDVLHIVAANWAGMTGTYTKSTGYTFDVFGKDWRGRAQVSDMDESYAIEFNTGQLGMPMLRTVYENAHPIGFNKPYDATFQANGAACGSAGVDSRFQIHAFNYDPVLDDVTLLTASFHAHCVDTPTITFDGCVHYSE